MYRNFSDIFHWQIIFSTTFAFQLKFKLLLLFFLVFTLCVSFADVKTINACIEFMHFLFLFEIFCFFFSRIIIFIILLLFFLFCVRCVVFTLILCCINFSTVKFLGNRYMLGCGSFYFIFLVILHAHQKTKHPYSHTNRQFVCKCKIITTKL